MPVLPFSITPPVLPASRGWTPDVPGVGAPADRPQRRRPLRAFLRRCWLRYQSRTELARMNAHMLRDIGMTFAEAEREASKPFWRA